MTRTSAWIYLKTSFQKLFIRKTDSLKMKSIGSAFWSILGKGSGHILRIAGNLILTRILFPEAFGLMATANVVLTIVNLFFDSGIKIALIHNPRGANPQFLNTAWVINIFRGILLGSVILSLSWPVSKYYGAPDLKYMLLIIGIAPIIRGFENPAMVLLIKTFKLSRKVGVDIATQMAGLISTIIIAASLKSVYALAIGLPVSSLFQLIASYIAFPYRPSFTFEKTAGKELLHFGKYVFINTLITAAVLQIDVLMIGKYLNMESLSFYNIGKNLGTLVMAMSGVVISQSYMPAVSVVQNDIERVQRVYKRTVSFFLSIAIPVSIVLALFSQNIVELMYDPRYRLSYIPMFWIGLASIFRVICNISGATFFAIGKPGLETASMGIGLILLSIILPIGINMAGLQGAAFSVALATSLIPVVQCIFLFFFVGFSAKYLLRGWGQAIFVSGLCIGIYFLLRPWLDTKQFYNIPFLLIMGLTSLGLSISCWLYLEGPNPFRDYTPIDKKRT